MNSVNRSAVRLGFWAVLLLGVFAWAPATYPGYWKSLEGFVPVFNVEASSAIASVATVPDLWRGTGRAAFLLAQPLLLMGVSPVAAVRALFILAFLLGGLGVYIWLEPRLGDRAAGLAGLAYMLLPPLLATVYVRGSLGDALIAGLLPLALAGTAIYAESRAPSAAAIGVLSILWMWRIQAGLAVFATLLLLLYALLVERHPLAGLVVAVSGAAGLVSLVPLWAVQAPPVEPFGQHFLYLHQLLVGQWTVAPSVAGWQDRYPFQLGFAVWGLGAVGFWLWRVDRVRLPLAQWRRLLLFSFGGAAILLGLTLGISQPLWEWTRASRLLSYPWQLLIVAAPLLAVVTASAVALSPVFQRPLLWTALVALVVLSSYPYLTADYTRYQPPERPVAIVGERQELVLLEAHLTQDPRHAVAELSVTWQVLHPLTFDYNVFFQALAPGENGLQVVAQLDTQPLQGKRPATTWQVGEILEDHYRLDLSQVADLLQEDPGRLQFYFGYYDWRDGSRLPVDGGIDDKLVFHGER